MRTHVALFPLRPALWLAAAVLWLAVACGPVGGNAELQRIDSLLMAEQVDSARAALLTLDPDELGDGAKAYHRLLSALAGYKSGQAHFADTLLAAPLAYFRQHDDREKLALTYFLMGTNQDELSNIDSALVYIKQAERLVGEGRPQLRHDIALYLSYLNNIAGNLNLAIDYAYRAAAVASAAGNRRWLGSDYLQLSNCYYHKNQKDSSNLYIDRLIPYLDDQFDHDLPDMLNNVAVSYMERGDMDTARRYLDRSLAIRPMEHTYYLLSQVYAGEGRKQEAIDLWERALQADNLLLKANISHMYAKWLQQEGDYKASSEMTLVADALADSLRKMQLGETALATQTAIDREAAVQESRTWLARVAIVVVVLALALVGLWMRNRVKGKRRQSQMEALQREVEQVQTQSAEQAERSRQLEHQLRQKAREHRHLADEVAQKNTELKSLQRRMKNEHDRLANGKERYAELFGDGNASQWNKTDAQDFLSYFMTVNPEVMKRVGNSYDGLSPNSQVLAILLDMGFADDAIACQLGLSAGALRTAKSRLNAHRL